MFAKRFTYIILTAWVLMLAVSGIFPAGAFDPNPNLLSSGRNIPDRPQSFKSHLVGEIQISPTNSPDADRYQPRVAYNWRHKEYLVVWHNKWSGDHRDIYARRVSESGEILSWFAVSAGTNDRAQPAVAYNGQNDEYLIVWMYNASGDGSTYDIWGRIVAWNGSYMKSEFQIINWTNRTFWTPRVAWNGYRNEYMVVWNAFDATTFTPTDVSHAMFDSDGIKLYGTIISNLNGPHQADLSYNLAADEYLVVWRSITLADGNIFAARLNGEAGTVVNPPGEFTVNTATEDQMKPAIATNEQHRYLVVWQQYDSSYGDWDIRGQELDVNGNLVGSVFSIASTADDETSPAVAARGVAVRDYLAVWQRSAATGEQIWAYHFSDDHIEVFEVAGASSWNNESPAVAWGHPSRLIVYEGDSQSDPLVYRHIYGRRLVPNAFTTPLILLLLK